MFEWYYKADEDNTTDTRIMCDIYEKDNNIIIDFVQFERSDFNKWGKQKVLTDIIVNRFYLPEIYSYISFKSKIASYIKENFDEDFSVIQKIEEMSKSKRRLAISLPISMKPHKRGIPTNGRGVKDTYLPLIVSIDGIDVSKNFIDFGDFEHRAVDIAYQALMQGNMPKSKNDIFYGEGVESLYKNFSNNEM